MQKYYIVPAEIMESNFPDEFADKTYPGKLLSSIETSMTADQIADKLVSSPAECDGPTG